jgi:hypothetical protein
MAVATATSHVQQAGGPASDMTQALAQEIVDYVLGAVKRDHEQAQSTGQVVSDQEAKQNLIAEVQTMIKNVLQPKEDKSKEGGHRTA